MQKEIVIAGGCFWCLESIFQKIKGIQKVTSGYAGDSYEKANYQMVSSGTTNHAEAVELEYNPNLISLEEILKIFFAFHDPTTLNRQGNDLGKQYRSAIFYKEESEKLISQEVIAQTQPLFTKPIVTQLIKLDKFYPAESYHQNYYNKNPFNTYCQLVINPKLQKLREKYSTYLT